jgi:hypothetical protein
MLVAWDAAGMFIKTKRVRRANRTYEYLTLVESVRIDGKNTHRTLYRLGEATALRESGELDRIIAALQAHAERRYVEVDCLQVDDAPMIGTMAAVRQLWDELGLEQLFDTIGEQAGVSWSLADAVFAMLAGRLIDPASKRRTARWIVDEVVTPAGFSFPTLEQYYRALDVVCEHKDVIERHVYAAVCDLTNLQLTPACYDLTSTYLEGDVAGHARFPSKAFGYSRNRRADRPQVVIGLLTSADGIPIAHHVFAGDTNDATTLKGVLEDLTRRFAVGRICVVADRGLITDDNINQVEQAGCDWLFATRLRRRKDVAAALATAAAADESDWVEVERFASRVLDTAFEGRRYVVVFSTARQRRDVARRLQLIAKTEAKLLALEARVKRGQLVAATEIAAATASVLARSPVRRLFDVSDVADGRFVYDYDHDALAYDEALAGHYALATSLDTRTADAEQVLAAYRSLQAFRGWRDLKQLELRPVYHRKGDRIVAHVQLSWLALLLIRTAELACRDTWRNLSHELDRIQLHTYTTGAGTVSQRTRLTGKQRDILDALELPEPPRYYQFEPRNDKPQAL